MTSTYVVDILSLSSFKLKAPRPKKLMVSTAPPPDEKSKTTHHMIHMYAETERGEKRLEDIDRILPGRGMHYPYV